MDSQKAKTAAPKPFTNMLSVVNKIKPGQVEAFRKELASATASGTAGAGSDILGILHFERFFIIDDTYLVFCSEFDGTLDSYLADFYSMEINPGPAMGLFDRAWKFTEDWPGSSSRDAFVKFWMDHKVDELMNYSYYPGVTAKEIRKAVRLQTAFQNVLDNPDAAEALKHPALKALLAEASD